MATPDRSRPVAAMPRRTFLKTAGAVGLGAAAGIEDILATGRAPAFAQATKIHLLQWVDFIPEGDVEARLWERLDEALKPFRTSPRGTRMLGHAGPPTAKATEVYTKYVITDMYAKAAQGMSAADAVKWAEGELKKIYEA